jgi:2-polyprenyl-3-methyl-5-hydroxy-6-metoxy-1,4-benzoquinol methylase
MIFARERVGIPPKTIIDFGCGDGSFAVELASSGFEVVAVDFPDVLASFKLQNANVRYMGMNLDEAWVDRLIPERFDVALCLEILEHLLRDYDFLYNIRRILKPSGYIILSVPLKDNMTIYDHHLRYFPKFSLCKLLQSAGYRNIELAEGDTSLLGVAYV